jgi:hypothetical protein
MHTMQNTQKTRTHPASGTLCIVSIPPIIDNDQRNTHEKAVVTILKKKLNLHQFCVGSYVCVWVRVQIVMDDRVQIFSLWRLEILDESKTKWETY